MLLHELIAKAVDEDEEHLASPGLDPKRWRYRTTGQRAGRWRRARRDDVRDRRISGAGRSAPGMTSVDAFLTAVYQVAGPSDSTASSKASLPVGSRRARKAMSSGYRLPIAVVGHAIQVVAAGGFDASSRRAPCDGHLADPGRRRSRMVKPPSLDIRLMSVTRCLTVAMVADPPSVVDVAAGRSPARSKRR